MAVRVLDQSNHDKSKQLDLNSLTLRLIALSQILAEKRFYPYQVSIAKRIIESVLLHDGDVITAILARQVGKCLAKGTPVMLAGGAVVPVENIRVGDLLMGDDSTPREVLSLARGREKMYRVVPRCNYGKSYTVNESHILSLIDRKGKKVDISVKDYLALSEYMKTDGLRGYRVPVKFSPLQVEADPYWLGLWIGDGKRTDTRITTGDDEIASYIHSYASLLGKKRSCYQEKGDCESYAITGTGKNKLYSFIKSLKGRKRIPRQYLFNSEDVRWQLLAGLIDSDGHKPKQKSHQSCCEISTKFKGLAEDIEYLALSLGLRASFREKICTIDGRPVGVYYIIHLYGELWNCPTRLPRKQYKKVALRENPQTYGFDLIPLEEDDYFGFCIDGNRRFLLGDFTVTHNTETLGSTCAALALALPALSAKFPDDWMLNITDDRGVYRGFKYGFKIGIYAPRLDQSGIMFDRVKKCFSSDTAKKVLKEFNCVQDVSNGNCIELSNRSRILCESASEQSKIEGATHQLVICEEAQDISDMKIRKSIHPMVASTQGTIVKIGTATTRKCDFYSSIKTNQRTELVTGHKSNFSYDYRTCQKFNSLYKKYIEQEKIRLGEDSDEFRTSYLCHWIFERGMFVTNNQLFHKEIAQIGGVFGNRQPTGLHAPNYRHYSVVAGIDWGKSHDSTVLTLVGVDWLNPVYYSDSNNDELPFIAYRKHIIDWLEFMGDNYEDQFWSVYEYLKQVRNLRKVVTDSNTCGQPIYDRLVSSFEEKDVEIVPFNFQPKIKSEGYRQFYNDICAKRFTFPASPEVRKSTQYRKFVNQMLDLQKTVKNNLMVVSHPPEKDAHDDFCDSAMMACYGANSPASSNTFETLNHNPFV